MIEGQPCSVAIIDDDEDITCLLEALVATRRDYEVVSMTDDPTVGERLAADLRPAVVVVGSHRSTFDPISLIGRLRAAHTEACIVLLADLADPLTLLDALACGATTVLSSGWGWAELLPTLDQLAHPPARDQPIRV